MNKQGFGDLKKKNLPNGDYKLKMIWVDRSKQNRQRKAGNCQLSLLQKAILCLFFVLFVCHCSQSAHVEAYLCFGCKGGRSTISLTIDDVKPRLEDMLCPLRIDWLPFIRKSWFSPSLSPWVDANWGQKEKFHNKETGLPVGYRYY